ncbi:MAG: tautomerase family protein [Synergistaceae bacterium]|jgi:4-oxalocrotonate tautomerase|nr:tautomerase family protein [Synergistaceae bacterium]
MPIIQVNLLEGRSTEQKRKAAADMTKVICEDFDVKPEQVRIQFIDMSPANFSIGGTLTIDKK